MNLWLPASAWPLQTTAEHTRGWRDPSFSNEWVNKGYTSLLPRVGSIPFPASAPDPSFLPCPHPCVTVSSPVALLLLINSSSPFYILWKLNQTEWTPSPLTRDYITANCLHVSLPKGRLWGIQLSSPVSTAWSLRAINMSSWDKWERCTKVASIFLRRRWEGSKPPGWSWDVCLCCITFCEFTATQRPRTWPHACLALVPTPLSLPHTLLYLAELFPSSKPDLLFYLLHTCLSTAWTHTKTKIPVWSHWHLPFFTLFLPPDSKPTSSLRIFPISPLWTLRPQDALQK